MAEVSTDDGTLYVRPGSKLGKVPYFFHNKFVLKRALNPSFTYGNSYMGRYLPSRDDVKTTVVKVDNIEKGLQNSTATRMSVRQFNVLVEFKFKTKYNPNAVFKLRLASTNGGPPKFAGLGKFGKTWQRSGDLKNHLNANRRLLSRDYAGADVLEIAINPENGVDVQSIKTIPLHLWYGTSGKSTYNSSFGGTL